MLRRLFRQSTTYAVAGVIGKLSGFVLLVYYGDPEILSEAEFGYLGALAATKMFALLVAGVGLPLGILRFASSSALSEADRSAVPATALVMAATAGALAGVGGWATAPWTAELLFGTAARAEPIRWLAVYIGVKTVSEVSYTVLRQREMASTYVLASATEALLDVALIVLFLVDGQGLTGVMKGYALSGCLMAAALTPVLLWRIERRVAWSLVGPLLAFGGPLIVSGLSGRFLNLGDRYVILYLMRPEDLGAYEWAARFGSVVNAFLVQGFVLAFTVLGMKALDDSGAPDLHRQAFRHFAALAGWVTLGLGLFVGDVSRALTEVEAYVQTEGLVLLIAGGFAFNGLYYVVVNVLYAAGRTRAVALSVGAAALLNLVLNLALIPVMGIAGAAVATLLAYGALAVLTARLAQTSTPAEYPWGALVLVALLVAGLWGLGQPAAAWGLGPRLALRVALAAAYVPALFAVGVYGRDDLARALDVVRSRGREHAGSTGGEEPGAPGGGFDAAGGGR